MLVAVVAGSRQVQQMGDHWDWPVEASALMLAVHVVGDRIVGRLIELVADADMLQDRAVHTQSMHNSTLEGHTVAATAADQAEVGSDKGRQEAVDHTPHHLL
jgi:hypothetical protein